MTHTGRAKETDTRRGITINIGMLFLTSLSYTATTTTTVLCKSSSSKGGVGG